MKTDSTNRFMSPLDLTVTPAVSLAISLAAILSTLALRHLWHLGLFASFAVFYLLFFLTTLLALKLIRTLFPIKEGVLFYKRDRLACYIWNLHGFLCITHLSPQYMNGLIPPPLRKTFYQSLGAKMGKGIISIGGRILDPYLVHIEEMAMIGDGVLFSPHAVMSNDTLVLGRIQIKRGAMIGANSMIMPGVTVGEHAMVNAMSLVTMNTQIGAYEIWGGNPAKKIGEIPRPEGQEKTKREEGRGKKEEKEKENSYAS